MRHSYIVAMLRRLRELGWRLEGSRWNVRIHPSPRMQGLWKGLKKGLFLFFYLLWWVFVLMGGLALTVFVLTVTWNVGPARLFGWNALAYHETGALIAFCWTIVNIRKGWVWYRRRLASGTLGNRSHAGRVKKS